mmetsp:Transcript_1342/g.3933  ORF Transcript_1342/g.3933 Transcript_1342/m.3933 type:complete len:218 (-) Transcript_1342:345-998(-)
MYEVLRSTLCVYLLCFVPRPRLVRVHAELDVQFIDQLPILVAEGVRHYVHQPPLRLVGALERALHDDLVVHLQQHGVAQLAQALVARDLHHGERDNVSRRALDGRVYGGALRVAARLRVLGVDVGQGAAAAQQRAHRAVAPRLLAHALLPVAHLGARVVPRLDRLLRLADRHIPILGQPVRRLAVRDGEVERLGLAPLCAVFVLYQRSIWRRRGVLF